MLGEMATSLTTAFDDLRQAARREPYPELRRRLHMLDALAGQIAAAKLAVAEAIRQDFGARAVEETLQAEIFPALSSLRYCRRRLARWMQPERRSAEFPFWLASNRVVYQPLGVIGILSPWNYPFYLAMGPLIGALAAGNRVIVRPSSRTPHAARAFKEIIEAALPGDVARVFCGEQAVAAEMLTLPFDHIVFTGSTSVGREVMRSAAGNLTPVTLELGGKSPAIVHDSYPHRDAARRIVFGKFLNAGQTCIAPDYVLVSRERRAELLQELSTALQQMYPAADTNPQFTSILGEKQHLRLSELIEDARAKGASILAPTTGQPAGLRGDLGLRFAPTLVADVTADMRVLQEEIFGPILPIVTYDSFEDVFGFLASRPRPLALYYFDRDRARIGRMLHETHSGGVVINDTLLHIAQDDLPFGGVGESGMGRYHGSEGFKAFSNQRSVCVPGRLSFVRSLHPPWTRRLRSVLSRMTNA
jgi:coniferyl-aldehyde dehydrogenase